jgi:hypothetical protein
LWSEPRPYFSCSSAASIHSPIGCSQAKSNRGAGDRSDLPGRDVGGVGQGVVAGVQLKPVSSMVTAASLARFKYE